MKWNDDWRMELERDYYDCFIRLCECRNTLNDIILMASLMYNYNKENGAEESLDRTIEWVCCWNSQYSLENQIYPNTYAKMLYRVLTNKL